MTSEAAVILAAGKSTRMRSKISKVLHKVCGKEMLSHVAMAVSHSGDIPITIVTPPDSPEIRRVMGKLCGYVIQHESLGTGHALLQARDAVEKAENILVVCADTPLITSETFDRMRTCHIKSGAVITVLTSSATQPDGLGRIMRDEKGSIISIIEEKHADSDIRNVKEVNGGFYYFEANWLWDNLSALTPAESGEIYLTDLVARASQQNLTISSVTPSSAHELIGVNNQVQLSEAQKVMRKRVQTKLMLAGVSIPDPDSVYIDFGVQIGMDSEILPNTHITGSSVIGTNCRVGPNSIVHESNLGSGCSVVSSNISNSTLSENVSVGPFSHIREAAELGNGVHVGTSAEIKNSVLGANTKMGHFSYMGDAHVGDNVNYAAGAITCNFDGEGKNYTTIGDNAFIGCDTMLVAPISVGENAYTGTGSVVTVDVLPNTLVVGVPARPTRELQSENKAHLEEDIQGRG